MKALDELLAAAVAQSAAGTDGSPTNSGRWPESWVTALFRKLQVLYGAKWSSYLDDVGVDEAVSTWADGLRGVTGEQVRTALQRLVTDGHAWPPTLPEFRALCTGRNEADREWRAFESRCRTQSAEPAGYLSNAPGGGERYGRDEAMRRIRIILGKPDTWPR